ncbi:MAG TPA: sigma 54-interacting transcriptional regulator [Thermoanaerobaculia bacterium]|nr:sigma 54-interacting transcriptional regulator [Thermoanaerobaculia bacterium]
MDPLVAQELPALADPPASLAAVLTEIAEIAAETLELQEVFDRVAASMQRVVPFEDVGVVRIVDGGAVLHASNVPCPDRAKVPAWRCGACADARPEPLTSWSPRLRPRPGPIALLVDAPRELDPAFPIDAALLANGVGSALWQPFRVGGGFVGGVWLSSSRPHAFTAEHQEMLAPIAAVLGSAVEHWRISTEERRRLERLDRLETLLATLAESLDVRELFTRLSAEVQPLLPHDLMALTELDLRSGSFRIVARAGESDGEVQAGPVRLSEEEIAERAEQLVHDVPVELSGATESERILLATGMRSWLRVPVVMAGEEHGGLSFLHREASRYDRGDVEVARRVADRVGLMLSHQQLAEEARLAAEERERAERLEATVETLARELRSRGHGRVVGTSPSWRQVLLQVQRVAGADTTVLITGESGTGKEVVAQLVHEGSPRASRPLVAINCAALPEQLLESELFGHEKGAFTGALASRIGRIEQAAGGTLFLDEIGEMSPLLQAKLLRVLQEREFQRLGGTRTLRADVRVLAATNRELAAAIARGDFREDLYYRLNVFEIRVPALRERPEDILVLAQLFLEELGRSMGRPAAGISRDAREWLLDYHWPGNVRELRNAVERAILLCDGGLIAREHLPAAIGRPEPARGIAGGGLLDAAAPLPSGGVDLESVERDLVHKALEQAAGNRSRAARLLGITRSQLYTRLDKYGLR